MKTVQFRFGVGSPDGPHSDVWCVKVKKSQVYVWQGNHGGVEKLSFHTPRYCAHAFDTAYGVPSAMEGRRQWCEWERAETPPAGFGGAALVARISIATDFLSTALEPAAKKVRWIPAAPPGMTRLLEFVFSRDDERAFRAFAGDIREVVTYISLENGEAFGIISPVSSQDETSFRVPASHTHKTTMIVSPSDPRNTGRPIRLTTFFLPKGETCLLVWEFGAFEDDGTFPVDPSMGTFTRTKLVAGGF